MGAGVLDADFITWRDNFLKHLLYNWVKGQRGATELWAVVELGPEGFGLCARLFSRCVEGCNRRCARRDREGV